MLRSYRTDLELHRLASRLGLVSKSKNEGVPIMSHVESTYPPEPQPSGMGSGMKVFLIILAVMGGFFVLCCGGFAIFAGYLGLAVKDAVSEDPVVIQSVQAEMAELTPPAGFEPKFSLKFAVPMTGQSVRVVMFEGETPANTLILAASEFLGNDPQIIQNEVRELLEKQGRNTERIDVEAYEEREFVVRGQPTAFYVGRGTDSQDRGYWQAIGVFEGKLGPTALVVVVDEETHGEEAITQVIESIR